MLTAFGILELSRPVPRFRGTARPGSKNSPTSRIAFEISRYVSSCLVIFHFPRPEPLRLMVTVSNIKETLLFLPKQPPTQLQMPPRDKVELVQKTTCTSKVGLTWKTTDILIQDLSAHLPGSPHHHPTIPVHPRHVHLAYPPSQ